MIARFARQTLFALLVVLLPLQGFVAAVQRVATPAHFHVLVATQGTRVTGMQPGDVIETLHERRDTAHIAGADVMSDHGHAVGSVGVMYFDSDDAGLPGSGSHKHAVTFDAVLPGWNMPQAPELAALAPVASVQRFASRAGECLHRPPRFAPTV